MQRQTVIVSGLLAYRMQRAAAARANAIGLEILMLPQLAPRLCGGFIEMAPSTVLFPLIRAALAEGGFSKFNDIAGLPGMPRAVMEALRKIWNADLDLTSLAGGGEQVADLKRIETAIRRQLPAAWLRPVDLRDRAVARVGKARKLLGAIVLDGVVDIEPLWRPLINALARMLSGGHRERSTANGLPDLLPSIPSLHRNSAE